MTYYVKDERFKEYRLLRNPVNNHSTGDSLQTLLRELISASSTKFFLANSMKNGNQEGLPSKIIFYQAHERNKMS